ncbi:MAG: hypothetical protein KGL36_12080 [Gammaproteobacteria bacterium]|nr:hypothetical protein [Gammaproteobacteria bacterium]
MARKPASKKKPARRAPARGSVRHELLLALGWLAFGAFALPVLIYLSGTTFLGRYDGATLGRTFGTVLLGLAIPSPASWIVVVGPYLMILLLRVLRWGWSLGSNPKG